MPPSVVVSHPGLEEAKLTQIIVTLPPHYLTVGMMFCFWNYVFILKGHKPLKNLLFSLINQQKIFLQILGIIKKFLDKVELGLCIDLDQQGFSLLNCSMDVIFTHYFLFIVESWTLSLTLASDAGRPLEVVPFVDYFLNQRMMHSFVISS